MKKHLPIIAAALLAASMTATAQSRDAFKAQWNDSTSVIISFPITESADYGSDYAVYSAPMLTNSLGDTLRLDDAMFRGKRNRKYNERLRHFEGPDAAPEASNERNLGDTIHYNVEIPYADAPWLWDGKIEASAEREASGCCEVKALPIAPIGSMVYVPSFQPMVVKVEDNTGKAGELQKDNPILCHISDYRPYDTSRILRKEEGALYVHFPLDKSVLNTDFRENAETLDKIVEITRAIMADSTSSVKIIQIIGLASVEGPVKRNNRLAGERCQALKQYIMERTDARDELFECVNGGEAWTELRDQISDSQVPARDEMLSIIDSEPDPTKRERRLRNYDGGRPYAYLRDNLLSDQRNSGYMRIYYDYVPDTAAHTINAASELLAQERYAEALAMLQTVADDPRAQNALGVAYYMTGNVERSLPHFRRAASAGNAQARQNIERIELILEREALR